MVRVACPTCFRVFHVQGGCEGRCPGCGQLVKAPDPDEAKAGIPTLPWGDLRWVAKFCIVCFIITAVGVAIGAVAYIRMIREMTPNFSP
jgi:hypothetical protein